MADIYAFIRKMTGHELVTPQDAKALTAAVDNLIAEITEKQKRINALIIERDAVKSEYAEFVKQHEKEVGADAWQDLSCDDQYRLATKIAGNVGYMLVADEAEIDPSADITKTTITTHNEEAGFTETVNVDIPVVVRELCGGRVDILLDAGTRQIVGYRLYDAASAEAKLAGGEVTEARLLQAVEFVAKWCWRTDPPNANNKLTDAERLSVIKHHPTIAKYGRPHDELAEREAALRGEASKT